MKTALLRYVPAPLLMAAAVFGLPVMSSRAQAPGRGEVPAPAAGVYGLAAALPGDTEAFVSVYRLRELWDGFHRSRFVKQVLASETLLRESGLGELLRRWENDPGLQQYGTLAASLLGDEASLILPAGFSANLSGIVKHLPLIQGAYFTAAPGGAAGFTPAMLPLVEAVAGMELPPVTVAFKAGAHREAIMALAGQAVAQIPSDTMAKMTRSASTVAGGSFEHLTIQAGKMMPEPLQQQMRRDLVQATGSEERGLALAGRLLSRSAEISWGWLGDYFVISAGSGHGHLNFTGPENSVLTLPELAPRVAQFAPKRPLSLSYSSRQALRTLGELGGVMDSLAAMAGSLKQAGLPVDVDLLVTELKAMEAKVSALWPNDADAMSGVTWWEDGLRGEGFGGPKPRAFDHRRPLTLGSLAGGRTVLLMEGRANGPFRDRVFGLLEDGAAAVWRIYQKEVKPKLPADTRQQMAIGELIGVPLVKELWKSFQTFRGALGDESALLVNLDGAVPALPGMNLPPEVMEKGLIPRLAWVSELADREKLAEAWSGLKTIVSPLAAIAGSRLGVNLQAEPLTLTGDGIDLFGFKLPADTGDFWPHVAAGRTHWFLSTSPSLTKELAGRPLRAAGPAEGSHWMVNGGALWDFADGWVNLLPLSAESGAQVKLVLQLARSFQGLDIHMGEENGQVHDSIHVKIRDAE